MGDVVQFTGGPVNKKPDVTMSFMGKDDVVVRFEDVKDDLVRNKLPDAIKNFLTKFEAFGPILDEPRFVCMRSLGIYTDLSSPIVATVEYVFCYIERPLIVREMVVNITVYRLAKSEVQRRQKELSLPIDQKTGSHKIRDRVVATTYLCSLDPAVTPVSIGCNNDAVSVIMGGGNDGSGVCYFLDVTEETL